MDTVVSPYSLITACRDTALVIGAGCLLCAAWRELWTLVGGFHAYFLAPWGIGKTNLKQFGSWAVVTGASDGIGRGYALELARRGLNVVLISRSKLKLEAVAKEIRDDYGTEVIIVPVDFTDGQAVFPVIEEKLEGRDIGILINNVGLSYIHPEYFLEVTKERHRQIIEVNCQTMVQMTHMLLPGMLKKNKGIIVNVSSISDVAPSPLLVTYGASKRFIRHFTDSLRLECGSKGVLFQTVASGMVATAMSNVRRAVFFSPDPIKYSRAAVATIGIQNYTYGYWPHALQQYVMRKISTRNLYTYFSKKYMQRSRRTLLRRKAEGTLISQLRQKKD